MADTMRYRCGPKVLIEIRKTGTVAISVGDILQRCNSSGRVMRVTGTTNATAVIGVAVKGSPATDTTATKVLMLATGYGTIFEFDLSAATKACKFGQQLKLVNAKPQQLAVYGTSTVDPFTSATLTVGIVAREMDASAGTCLVLFKPSKFFGRVILPGKSYTATKTP
jgi:hypothetical protein